MDLSTARLDKKERDALSDDHFAVPGKRKLPIHDERHTKLAWDMVDRTHGLTPDEKREARRRILKRAGELGVDTKDWNKIKAATLRAMSLNIAHDDDHPNKMPFTGVLTKLDEPSDEAPGGSGGRRVIVTSEAAKAALGTLLGMAVDFTPDFDGHDVQAKIGIITSADIVGNELQISGFVYAADFPQTADLIKKLKDVLGFSFEAQRLYVEDMNAEILKVIGLTFTGAAILLKDKAAYQTTSLAASAEGELQMTAEELKALLGPVLAEALKPFSDRLDQVEKNSATVAESLQANAAVRNQVEPHAAALEAAYCAMEAAGVGTHPKYGHIHTLRCMSDSMRAEAAMGKVPHIWRDHDYPYEAAADTGNTEESELKKEEIEALVANAVAAAIKPLQDANKALEEKLAAAETKVKDAQTTQRLNAGGPQRKTIDSAVMASLNRAGITLPEGDAKLKVAEVDKALQASGLDLTRRIMVKTQLERIGALAA